jgi:serine/threonine protein phosphatase PrpC
VNRSAFEITEFSLTGDREENQDRCITLQSGECALLGLADGMGGHPRGDLAAEILVDTCHDLFHQSEKPVRDPEGFLSQLLQQAHDHILAYGAQQNPPLDPRTTAVVALVQNGTVYWAHIGDSRFYLFRHGEPVLRTRDHSYLEELQAEGIPPSLQQDLHLIRNYVTRCLGGAQALPQITIGTPELLQPKDVLLLCSDGFWGALHEAGVGVALQSPEPLDLIIPELVRLAERNSNPESDNVSAIGLRWMSPTQPSEEAPELERELQNTIDELEEVIDIIDHNKEPT